MVLSVDLFSLPTSHSSHGGGRTGLFLCHLFGTLFILHCNRTSFNTFTIGAVTGCINFCFTSTSMSCNGSVSSGYHSVFFVVHLRLLEIKAIDSICAPFSLARAQWPSNGLCSIRALVTNSTSCSTATCDCCHCVVLVVECPLLRIFVLDAAAGSPRGAHKQRCACVAYRCTMAALVSAFTPSQISTACTTCCTMAAPSTTLLPPERGDAVLGCSKWHDLTDACAHAYASSGLDALVTASASCRIGAG